MYGNENSFISLGLAGEHLLSKGLMPFANLTGSPFVWILSTNLVPQPANKAGIWNDGGLWVDTNVWYD